MEHELLTGYGRKWFVLHHRSLFNENKNLIGFRDYDQWYSIKEGDLVVYYQAGATKLRGVYKVINSNVPIDPNFGKIRFQPGELKHQHELALLRPLGASFHQKDAEYLSFHKNLKNPIRWDGKEVFPITDRDLQYILSL